MGFLIREGARLVVRLPQEVDHHKTESIRIQVDQMIRNINEKKRYSSLCQRIQELEASDAEMLS